MSERSEAVRASLGSEWRSTRELADAIGPYRGIMPESQVRSVYKHLRRMERRGEVEKEFRPCGGQVMAYWRLAGDRLEREAGA